jgi:hypothetical protein
MARISTFVSLGDGVYGEFDGDEIRLTANGIGPQATDTIIVEKQTVERLQRWVSEGYPDHNSGQPFDVHRAQGK